MGLKTNSGGLQRSFPNTAAGPFRNLTGFPFGRNTAPELRINRKYKVKNQDLFF